MYPEQTTVERAFRLAGSGQVRSIEDIRRKLKSEGYGNVDAHLSGVAIRNQLKASIVTASKPASDDPTPC
jgi:hypothetical protein